MFRGKIYRDDCIYWGRRRYYRWDAFTSVRFSIRLKRLAYAFSLQPTVHAILSFTLTPLKKLLFLHANSQFLLQSNDHSFALQSTTSSRKVQHKVSHWCAGRPAMRGIADKEMPSLDKELSDTYSQGHSTQFSIEWKSLVCTRPWTKTVSPCRSWARTRTTPGQIFIKKPPWSSTGSGSPLRQPSRTSQRRNCKPRHGAWF